MTIQIMLAAAAATRVFDDGGALAGRGHIPRCTSQWSAVLASAGVRYVRIASGGAPSRAFPLAQLRAIEHLVGVRIVGKIS